MFSTLFINKFTFKSPTNAFNGPKMVAVCCNVITGSADLSLSHGLGVDVRDIRDEFRGPVRYSEMLNSVLVSSDLFENDSL